MIYLFYIAIFIAYCFNGQSKNWSTEEVNQYTNGFLICLAIIPIWYGIRQGVKELEKIRKQLENLGGGKS